MKQKWIKLLSFLAVIVLVAGLTTMAGVLKPAPTVKVEDAQDEQITQNRLSVAIVNEDTGTTYNGQAIDLGQLFAERIISQSPYQVAMVSRSLANRGLDDGQYHLMVLLPSDFSAKSMGLEMEQPEQATIQYKVNGNSALEVQQLAQNAANQLVQDMNQELIDIYFSSILGNLVNAQANVLDVVQREGNTLRYYSDSLMSPMNQFSNLFRGLTGVSNQSESSLGSLDRNLETTNQRFTNIVDQDRNYAAELATIVQAQTEYADNILNQHESMISFEEQMASLSVEEQIALIQARNEIIEEEFLNHPVYQNVVENTELINTYLTGLSNNLQNRNEGIQTYLDEEFAPNVQRILAERLRNEDNQFITLEQINQPVHQAIKEQIFAKVDALPSLNKQEITDSTWTDEQKETFNRVVDFSNLFLQDLLAEDGPKPQMKIKPGLGLAEPLNQVIHELRQEGRELSFTTSLDLDDAARFLVELPDKFTITQAVVHYQDGASMQTVNLTPQGNQAASEQLTLVNETGQQVVRLEMAFQLNEGAAVTFNEAMVTEFTIDKQANRTIEGQKKSIMDVIKQLFGLDEVQETVVQFFTPSVQAAELPEEAEEVENTEETQEPAQPEGTPEQPEQPNLPGEEQDDEPIEEPIEEEEPIGDPFIITKRDKIILYHTTPLVPDRRTLEQNVLSQAAAPYQELAALIELYYGYDVAAGESVPEELVGKAESVMALLNTEDLADTITQSLVNELVRDVSRITETTESVLADIAALQLDADAVAEQMTLVNAMNASLNGTVGDTLQEAIRVQDTLSNRTPFEPVPLEDPEGMVTVATQIHDELMILLQASEELIGQTEENKKAADSVYEVFDELNQRVQTLEEEGSQLQNSSEQFMVNFADTYNENLSFAENFSQVMTNSQIGNRKNETLYQYLSQPIGMTNQSVPAQEVETTEPDAMVEGAVQVNHRTAFITTILAYLISLLTAYVFHQYGDVRFGQKAFAKETYITKNVPVSIVAAGAGLLEGVVIGFIAASQLELSGSRTAGFIIVMMGVLLAMVAVNTWLLRQLSSIGMFLSLGTFTLYLISANQLMLGTFSNWNATLQSWNPLRHLENLMMHFLSDQGSWVPALVLTFAIGMLFVGLNLVVRKWRLQPAK